MGENRLRFRSWYLWSSNKK